jgi:hypothetical protein
MDVLLILHIVPLSQEERLGTADVQGNWNARRWIICFSTKD